MSPAAKTPDEKPDEKATPSGWKEAILELAELLLAADIGDDGKAAILGFMKKHG